MGRGDQHAGGSARGRRQKNTSNLEPTPRHLADEAESLQQQGERRKGLEAAAKFDAAASRYQDTLYAAVRQRQLLGLSLAPPDSAAGGSGRGATGDVLSLDDCVEIRSNMAECRQLLAEAVLAAAATRTDAELTPEVERQAAAEAVGHLITSVGHYACCHPDAVLTAPPPGGVIATGTDANASMTAAFVAASTAAAAAVAAAAALAPDVAVNAGNCLAALAEQLEEEAGRVAAATPAPAAWLPLYDTTLQCYRSSAECYRSAVAREEDALTLSNLGDVLVQSGTCMYGVARAVREAQPDAAAVALTGQASATAAGPGAVGTAVQVLSPVQWAAAREAEAAADFAAAMASYEAACALSDSSQGDDLPGLLCNWGAGLLSMAGCLPDPAARLAILEQAAGRLSHAASFDRGDPAPLCTLGDVLTAAGEAAEAIADAAAAAGAGAGSAGPSGENTVVHWHGVATGHLQSALDRGYDAALRLRQDEPEALVGAGEVNLALGRLALKAARTATAAAAAGTGTSISLAAAAAAAAAVGGGAAITDAVRGHAVAAVEALQLAIARPERLGGWRQRYDVRYNLACALALAGREQDAHGLFTQLLTCGAVRLDELVVDVDLAPVRELPWFRALLS